MDDLGKNLSPGNIIGNKFKLEEQVGRGSFGMIWKCINTDNQETYAVKFEKRQAKQSSMLVREIKVMLEMKEKSGFPRLISYGKDEDHNYVIMSFMGRNMDSILKKSGGKFQMQTLCNIAQQMITRLESLHSKNLIHRDIKPDNYVIGHGHSFNIVHLLDFGLAKYYKDSDGNHIPFIKKRGMIGTARYASVNAHLGHEQSRRDDLEGLGYVLMYFTRGKLPWQNIYAESKEEKYEKIKNMKQNSTLEQLCEGIPQEFIQYFKHVKNLSFTDDPDYNYLKQLFKKILSDRNLEPSDNVDWQNLPEYKRKKQKPSLSVQPNNNVIPHDSNHQISNNKLSNSQFQASKLSNNNNNNSNNDNKISNFNNIESKSSQVNKPTNNNNNQAQESPMKGNSVLINKQQQQPIQNNSNNNNTNNNSSQIQKISQQNRNDQKKNTMPVKQQFGLQKQRDSFLSPSGIQGNVLQLPGSSLSAIGSTYSQTAAYSVQGGEQSWGTSRVNQFEFSNFEQEEIENDEGTLNLDLKMKKQNLQDLGELKTDIRRKSAQLSQFDVLGFIEEQKREEESSNNNNRNKKQNNNGSGIYNKPQNQSIFNKNNEQSQRQKRESEFYDNTEAIQEEGSLGSFIGENITTNNQDTTVKGQRQIIQILNIKQSYKNNENDK